jgi:hypothetical protein
MSNNGWSEWQINTQKSDYRSWTVYRAFLLANGQYVYDDELQYSTTTFPTYVPTTRLDSLQVAYWRSEEELLQFLNGSLPQPAVSTSYPEAHLPCARLTVSDVGYGNALEVDDLTDRTQNLQIRSNNPFHERQSTASASGSNPSSRNPFLANSSSASQSRRPPRRSTPAAGHSTNRYISAQRGDSAAGYLSPPQAYTLDPRSQTPSGGADHAQQAASRLPRSYTSHSLSRTSQGHGYSQPTVEPSVLRAKWRNFVSTDQRQIKIEHARVPGYEG